MTSEPEEMQNRLKIPASPLIIKNTFVDVISPSVKERSRQLRPHLSCSDVPDLVLPAPDPDLEAAPHPPLTVNTADDSISIDTTCGVGTRVDEHFGLEGASSEQTTCTGYACGVTAGPGALLDHQKRSCSQTDVSPHPVQIKTEEHPPADRDEKPLPESTFYPWVVDARKLEGFEKVVVSQPFEVLLGGHCATFRLIMSPKAAGKSGSGVKGALTFRKSEGWGSVQVKCETSLPITISSMSYRIWVGNGDHQLDPRGPVHHNFGLTAVSGLPKAMEQWNFNVAVDPNTSTLTIILEQLPAMDMERIRANAVDSNSQRTR